MTAPLRVLVCEDSATYALGLKRFLETGGDIDVVAVCSTGEEAIETLPRVVPDLVTMDLELPGMGGIRAVEKIMRTHPVPILVLSGQVRRGSSQAAAALTAGAVDALPKAQVRVDDPTGSAAVALRYRFRRLAAAKVGQPDTPAAPARRAPIDQRRNGAKAIGICASTGGPRALEIVLAGLPANFPIPLLVVQHMTAGFTEGLASWLDRLVPLQVALAAAGQPLGPGVWVAPDDSHLVVGQDMTFALDSETEDGHHRPSGDVLLESLAGVVGSGTVAVVLSGMGRDGARGVIAVRRAGGRAIAQDERTSAIYGMPQAAAEAGADLVLPLSGIAPALLRMAPVEARA